MNREMMNRDYARRSRRMYDGRGRRRDGLMMEDMRRYNDGESEYSLPEITRQNRPIDHDPYIPYMTKMQNERYDNAGSSDYARNNMDYARRTMDYGRRTNDYARGRNSSDGTRYNFDVMGGYDRYDGAYNDMYDYARGRNGRYSRDRNMNDYASESMLSDEELEMWSKKLMKEVEEKDKPFFEDAVLEKKAQEMGIKFDKFSFEDFKTTVLMMYTDYCKTLGTANMDIYLKLAKDWLCDEDADVQYGEKLATYHDYIVEGM